MSLPKLGLDSQQYSELASKIDGVLHGAAVISHTHGYTSFTPRKADMRTTNTIGMLNVLEFASCGKTKPVTFISTIAAISKRDHNDMLSEEFPDVGDYGENITSGYGLSKLIAEKLLAQANSRGIPCKTLRLGLVLGHTEQDHAILTVVSFAQLGMMPDWPCGRPYTPVDTAAKVIKLLFLNDNAQPGAYNINNPHILSTKGTLEMLTQRGYSVKLVSEEEWIKNLKKAGKSNVLHPFQLHYPEAIGFWAFCQMWWPAVSDMMLDKFQSSKLPKLIPGYNNMFPTSAALLNAQFDYLESSGFMAKVLPSPGALHQTQNELRAKL